MNLSLHELENAEVVRFTQDNMVELMRFWSSRTTAFEHVEDVTGFRVFFIQ